MVTCMDGTRLREVDGELRGWKLGLEVALEWSYEIRVWRALDEREDEKRDGGFHPCKRL